MTFIIENEQMMLMELLEMIEMELGIDFSPSEFKVIQEYLRNNPSADPKKVMEEIFAVAQKKLNKQIEKEKSDRIKKRCENAKLFAARRLRHKTKTAAPQEKRLPQKTVKPKLTDKEVKRIIDEAEKKLLDKKKIKKLNDKEKQKAKDIFANNIKTSDSLEEKANIALLGVMCSKFAGAVQPIIREFRGNFIGIADKSPEHGLAPIDQGSRIDFAKGDPIGTEALAVIRVIQNSTIDPQAMARLDGIIAASELGQTSSTSTSRAPTLAVKPPGGNPYNPFE